jgi:uncharacterized protein
MRLTEARISHWSHLLRKSLQKSGAADFPDDSAAHREAKAVLSSYARMEEEADAAAREKISRLSRRVQEGEREWDILYRKYLEEEMTRRKL